MSLAERNRPHYQSYLLRLWWDAAQGCWHASLQSTATEHTYHFPTVEAMLAFLVARQVADGDGAAPMLPSRTATLNISAPLEP